MSGLWTKYFFELRMHSLKYITEILVKFCVITCVQLYYLI